MAKSQTPEEEIDQMFRYQKPAGQKQIEQCDSIREAGRGFAQAVARTLPETEWRNWFLRQIHTLTLEGVERVKLQGKLENY